ncbi:MAG: right-handed parallel beta-helix repeat-containing protein, partial [Zoogloeaceae bacterium]|nr:right-handed parallel beta-helix repeat-containing protein [Zoogloeaceae bacterium]
MSSDSDNAARRRFLAASLSLAAMSAAGFPTLGRRRIRDFGRIYDYLKDVDLRLKEAGSQRITIKDADFSGEKFNDEWGYYDFVDCKFVGAYSIQLNWLVDCTFTNCSFKGIFGLGHAEDVKFLNCSVDGESHVAFFSESTDLVFEDCRFTNSNYDRN